MGAQPSSTLSRLYFLRSHNALARRGATPMPDAFESHYRTVVRAITEGRVIPLLGAGVNLCGRPQGSDWQRGKYLPSGAELAAYLASYFEYPTTDLQDLI